MSYEAVKKRAEPYTKIVEVLPEMRQAVSAGRHAYVLKGNAPLTVQALVDGIMREKAAETEG